MANAANTTNPSALSPADLNTINDEPRIRDLRLAEALGMKNVHSIRELIERHLDALMTFGEVSRHAEKPTRRGGRPSAGAFYLTKKQALYITAKSDTERAALVTIQMVEVFDAATSPANAQPSLALPSPTAESCPPFCGDCAARKRWLTGLNDAHNPNPLIEAPLNCEDLRMLATLRPLVARMVHLQISDRILDATIAMQKALSGKEAR
jgi:hypothetical protein